MRRWLVFVAVAAVVIVVGLSRLELDADVFGLLPRDCLLYTSDAADDDYTV